MTGVITTQAPAISLAAEFLKEIEDIKCQHEKNHISSNADKNENVHKLQARFLDAYEKLYKSDSKKTQKAIEQSFEEKIRATCLSLRKGTPLERFIHYTFHFTSWRTQEFVKDIKLALKEKISIADYPSWVKNQGSLIDRFELVTTEIYMLGEELTEREGKLQQVAIRGLNKIYSTVTQMYDGAKPEEKVKILAFSKQKCRAGGFGGSDKNTTIYHVFSKMFRRANSPSIRQQASNDARLLLQASKDGVKAEKFETWILEQGGINEAILNARRKAKPQADESQAKNEQHEQPFKQGLTISFNGKTVPKALKVLQSGNSYSSTIVARADGGFDLVINEQIDNLQGKNVAAKPFIKGGAIKSDLANSKGRMQLPLLAQYRSGIRKSKIKSTKLKAPRLMRTF